MNNQKNNFFGELENKIKEEKNNKKLIGSFLIGGTAVCLGIGYFCDNTTLSTAGYVGSGLGYKITIAYFFGNKIADKFKDYKKRINKHG